ncbi:unnamed protein product [Staurois parvus]|uniref:acetate--CoA ligase n=1 Tax=Staurois parvus TaxID=386267 RepID=A0ABN9FSD5_9NEOB|nr:unnamed protein product [Staurois parvus]
MIPELVYSMLACARIGAVHSIVFAGFSSESLCERILDSQCAVLITAGMEITVCFGRIHNGTPCFTLMSSEHFVFQMVYSEAKKTDQLETYCR